MSKKKTVLLIIIAFVLGIGIGVGVFYGINYDKLSATMLIDENSMVIEEDDTVQEGVSYYIRVVGRIGEEIDNAQRVWYGPYDSIKVGIEKAEMKINKIGFYEIYVYKVENGDTSTQTFVGRTLYTGAD